LLGVASNVGVSAKQSDRGDFEMHVFYSNISNQPILIDPWAIRVAAMDENKAPKYLDAFTAGEYMQKVMKEQQGKEIFTTLLDTVVAAGSAIASTATGAVSTVVDTTQSIVSSTGLVQKMKETNDMSREMNAATYESLIQPHTLPPKGFSSGRVMAPYDKAKTYRVLVPVGDETHEIEFMMTGDLKNPDSID
jgi:hypothetical protein